MRDFTCGLKGLLPVIIAVGISSTVSSFSTSGSLQPSPFKLRCSIQGHREGVMSLPLSRRQALSAFIVALPGVRSAEAKTPVRAPLPPGPPNPADKQKLIESEALIESWGRSLKDPAAWPPIVEAVSKGSLSPDALDELFRYAAKNLPPNNLLGTDAGQWAGLKVESVQAMESFATEVMYLLGQSQKGSKDLDTSDLVNYHSELVAKMKDFIALYDNKIENKYLPQLKTEQ